MNFLKQIFITSCFLIISSNLLAAEPVFLDRPLESLYPRSEKPAEVLDVYDAFHVDGKTKVLLTTAQGIINKDKPGLYLILKKPGATAAQYEKTDVKHDLKWLNWLQDKGYLDSRINWLYSVEQLLEKYEIKDVIQVDPDFPASLNIATMMASIKGIPAAYPEQVKKYELNVVEDLKSRWDTNIEAYKWAYENFWDKMDHTAISYLAPKPEISQIRDYLVSKKIFTFWITGEEDSRNKYSSTKKEKRYFTKLLNKMPVNIPVLGFPWAGWGYGIGEGQGLPFISRTGKFLIPMEWKANLSVWTGIDSKIKNFKQKPTRVIKLEDKVYITFLLSDGDNLNTWYDYFPMYWEHEQRSQLPVGWAMGPSLIDMQAPVVDYYYNSLSEMDSFGAAPTGVGYIWPRDFATNFGDKKEKVWDEFLELTDKYMSKLAMEWVWVFQMGGKGSENFYDYAEKIEDLEVIYADYRKDSAYEEANYFVDDVAVFHAINGRGADKTLQYILEDVPDELPGFMMVCLSNWRFTFEHVKELVDSLPENFVVVRPDELAELYKQYKDK